MKRSERGGSSDLPQAEEVLCPRCRSKRVGRDPFCRTCGLNYDGLDVDPGSAAPCPYGCGLVFVPAPGRARACPKCGGKIVVQGYEAKTLAKAARDEMAPLVGLLGFAYDDLEAELRAADPSVGPEDVHGVAIERAANREAAEGNWEVAAHRYAMQVWWLQSRGLPFIEVARERQRVLLRVQAVGTGLGAAVVITSDMRCCKICDRAKGRAIDLDAELQNPSLPHEGCASGTCSCFYEVQVPKETAEERRAIDETMRALGIDVRFGPGAEFGVVIRDGVEAPLVEVPAVGSANGLPVDRDMGNGRVLVTWPDGSYIQVGQPVGFGRLYLAWSGGYLVTSDAPRTMHGNWGQPGGPWHGCGCISPTPRRFAPDATRPDVTEPATYAFVGEIHPDYEGVEPEGMICGRCSRAMPAP